jgi:N-acetylglucosaminyldiphosphoundecaprenol N-acetyl-beta-D-mannosaminyltransferase
VTIELFNLRFEEDVLEAAASKIVSLAVNNEKSLIVTPNVDHIVNIRKDAEMKEVFHSARYRFADGMPLVWSSFLLPGIKPLPERVTGADLLPEICRQAANKQQRVFLLGGQEGVAKQAADNLIKKNKDLIISGYYCPPFGFEKDALETEKIISIINKSNSDVLFIGVGTPKQEKWAYRNIDQLKIGPIIGVGAAFDFAAGNIKRAPSVMQRLGIEWLWRLFHEPRRLWKRYLVDGMVFLYLFAKETLKQTKSSINNRN